MKNRMCIPLLVLTLLASARPLSAQFKTDYWDQTGYLSIAAGPATPGRDLAGSVSPGLMANNGFIVNLDYNYMLVYGFGVGLNLGLDYFGLNEEAFLAETNPQSYNNEGGFMSGRVGLNLLMNIPLEIIPQKLTLNITGELNGGLRSYSIPDVDLYYSELTNKYTEISYRSRENLMGYAGYSTGVQVIFGHRFGVNVTYSALFSSRHLIDYSMRAFDAAGTLYEEEDYLSASLDRAGFQFGILYILSSQQ